MLWHSRSVKEEGVLAVTQTSKDEIRPFLGMYGFLRSCRVLWATRGWNDRSSLHVGEVSRHTKVGRGEVR